MQRSLSASLLAGLVIVMAACGGAIANDDLFQKESGTASGGTTTPTPSSSPTSSPTTAPTNTPTPTPKPTVKCDASFKTDVLGIFANHGCSQVTCHGGPAALNDPAIDTTNAQVTYKEITTFKMSTGRAYVAVGNTEPKASGMFCNLRGNCGTAMPLGDNKLDSQELDVIDTWLACGAPFN